MHIIISSQLDRETPRKVQLWFNSGYELNIVVNNDWTQIFSIAVYLCFVKSLFLEVVLNS